MSEPDEPLQRAFVFHPADVRSNREGRLSPRQAARQRALGGTVRLAIAVFVLVMLGTAGFFAFMTWRSEVAYRRDVAPLVSAAAAERAMREGRTSLAVAAAVIGVVIVGVGAWFLREHARAETRRISVASGPAEAVAADDERHDVRVRIGSTTLRLATLDQLAAFAPGVEYRVFYLAGPRPTILSAEAVGTGPEATGSPAVDGPVEADAVVRALHRGRAVLVVLALLAVGIPFAGVAASSLSGGARDLAWLALLVASIGFAFWAVRRVSRP